MAVNVVNQGIAAICICLKYIAAVNLMYNKANSIDRFLYCSECRGTDIQEIDDAFHNHMKHQPELSRIDTIVSNIRDIHSPSEKQQFELFSTIYNYHLHGYPRTKDPSSIRIPDTLTYAEHMLHDANARIDENGSLIRQHIPTSPRNRLLYFISTGQDVQLYHLVKYLLWCEKEKDEQYTIDHDEDESSIEPPRKKRKQSARMVSVSRMAIFAEVGEDMETGLNKANSSRTIYTNFTEQLLADGIIKWRFHSENKDICVMNDYNPTTGLLMPQGFVHVTCTAFHGDQMLIHCTCSIFNLIKRAAH